MPATVTENEATQKLSRFSTDPDNFKEIATEYGVEIISDYRTTDRKGRTESTFTVQNGRYWQQYRLLHNPAQYQLVHSKKATK